MVSDQGSTLFACQLRLLYDDGLNAMWFPGMCHQESNCEATILPAAGMDHIWEKNDFLTKLHHGPMKKRGHWHGQIKTAAEAVSVY